MPGAQLVLRPRGISGKRARERKLGIGIALVGVLRGCSRPGSVIGGNTERRERWDTGFSVGSPWRGTHRVSHDAKEVH